MRDRLVEKLFDVPFWSLWQWVDRLAGILLSPSLIFSSLPLFPFDLFVVVDNMPLLLEREVGKVQIPGSFHRFKHFFDLFFRIWFGEVELSMV
jgi:hypothetical protein